METKREQSGEHRPAAAPKRVIRLDDLDFEDDAVGGASGKLYFGEEPERPAPGSGSSLPGFGGVRRG